MELETLKAGYLQSHKDLDAHNFFPLCSELQQKQILHTINTGILILVLIHFNNEKYFGISQNYLNIFQIHNGFRFGSSLNS